MMSEPRSAIHVLVGSDRTSLTVDSSENEKGGLQLSSSPAETRAVMQQVKRLIPDVVVVDTPPADAPNKLITDIRHATPHTRVVAVTENGHPEEVAQAFMAGATGIVSAASTPAETVAVIDAVMHRRTFLPDSHVAELILNEFRLHAGAMQHLTGWERKILRRIKQGHTHKQFKGKLGLEKNMLENHLGNIMTKVFELNHSRLVQPTS